MAGKKELTIVFNRPRSLASPIAIQTIELNGNIWINDLSKTETEQNRDELGSQQQASTVHKDMAGHNTENST